MTAAKSDHLCLVLVHLIQSVNQRLSFLFSFSFRKISLVQIGQRWPRVVCVWEYETAM